MNFSQVSLNKRLFNPKVGLQIKVLSRNGSIKLLNSQNIPIDFKGPKVTSLLSLSENAGLYIFSATEQAALCLTW